MMASVQRKIMFMKRLLLIAGCLWFMIGNVMAGMDSGAVVKLYSNGYVYPEQRSWRDNSIGEKGLVRWSDAEVSARVFFYPKESGVILVSVRLRCPDGDSRIRVQLDGVGEGHEVAVEKGNDLVTLPAKIVRPPAETFTG